MPDLPEPKKSSWTNGFRVLASVDANGSIVLTIHSRIVSKNADAGDRIETSTWVVSQLGLPAVTHLLEGRRLTKHWLSYYGDAELEVAGLNILTELLAELPEKPETGPASPGSQGSALN